MAEKGTRKFKDSRENGLILLVAFIIAAWLKVSAEIFFVFVGGLVGKSAAFNWGNSKEWSATKDKEPAKAP